MSGKKCYKESCFFMCAILILLIIALTVSCSPTINIYPQGQPKVSDINREADEEPTAAAPITAPTEGRSEMIATQKPKSTKVPPTPIPPTAIPPTPVPTVTLGVVDMGDGFWLTYDTELWKVNSDRGYNFLQSRNYNGCNIMYQFGHGMDMNTFEVNSFSKTLGGKTFDVARWTRISNGDLILLAFYYGSDYFSVENPNAATLSAECEAQAYDVVALSAENDFMP